MSSPPGGRRRLEDSLCHHTCEGHGAGRGGKRRPEPVDHCEDPSPVEGGQEGGRGRKRLRPQRRGESLDPEPLVLRAARPAGMALLLSPRTAQASAGRRWRELRPLPGRGGGWWARGGGTRAVAQPSALQWGIAGARFHSRPALCVLTLDRASVDHKASLKNFLLCRFFVHRYHFGGCGSADPRDPLLLIVTLVCNPLLLRVGWAQRLAYSQQTTLKRWVSPW